MEDGSFQNLNLQHLDFASDVQEDFQEVPMTPRNQRHEHAILNYKVATTKESMNKSASVQTLFAQNEDLMARLKVTIQRLNSTEEENQTLNEEFNDLRKSFSALSDQMLVWKEKERIWKEKNSHLESEVNAFNKRFPDYKNMEARIERYQRYQEKVKNQIKPYVQQLKGYAQSLHEQILGLNREIEFKESNISDLKHQIMAVKEKLEMQIQFYEINQNDLVSNFEKERSSLLAEIRSLNESNQALEMKAQKLDRSLERQDELENLVVALRRSKEEFQSSVETELETTKMLSSEQKASLQEKDLMIEDLKKNLESLKDKMSMTENKKDELQEQLTSLRYMWTSKSEENEKLKISMASLEKINLELSNKLNNLRKENEAEL